MSERKQWVEKRIATLTSIMENSTINKPPVVLKRMLEEKARLEAELAEINEGE